MPSLPLPRLLDCAIVVDVLVAVVLGAWCWAPIDVPQDKPQGYALDRLSLDVRATHIALAWADGRPLVATGTESALVLHRELPEGEPAVFPQPVATQHWALVMDRYHSRADLFELRDGGYDASGFRALLGARGERRDYVLVELRDGGAVTVGNDPGLPAGRVTMLEEPIATHLDALDQSGAPLAVDVVGAKGLLTSTDADGTPWIAWHNNKSMHLLKLQGRQWVSIGGPIAGIDARSLRFTHAANEPVVAWTSRGEVHLVRGSKPIAAPSAARHALSFAIAGSVDGALFFGWTERDAMGQPVAMIERMRDGDWLRIASGLQLDDGDNYVDALELAAPSSNEVFAAFEEDFGDRRIRLVKLTSCDAPQPFPVSKPRDSLWPHSVSEAVAQLLKDLDADSRLHLSSIDRKNLIEFHHGWGTGIRNGFGLWRGNDALLKSCGKPVPDDCSMVIMQGVWDALHADGGTAPTK